MTTRRFIVVASKTAWVDPSCQVHDAGCSHGLTLWHDPEWTPYGPCQTESQAEFVADEAAKSVGASNVAWCDCALFPVGA